MALDDDIAILARAPLFGLIERDAQRLLSFAAERRELAPGEALFERDQPADGGFVVLAGTLALEPRLAGGTTVLAEEGALVGRHALLVPQRRPTTARALTACEVMLISSALMRRVLVVFPAAAEAIRDALLADLAELEGGLSEARRAFEGA